MAVARSHTPPVQHWNLNGRPCGASQTGPCLQAAPSFRPVPLARSPSPVPLRREETSPVRFGTPKAVCGQRTALTPPPGFGHVRGRLGPMHGEQVRRPFPHLVTPPMAQAFPTLSPAAALLAASPHMVTRGSLPPTGLLRTPLAVPCQPISMSTPSLNPFPDAAPAAPAARAPSLSGTPRTPASTPVFRSRSYTPTPLLMRQSVIPAAVTAAPPIAELVARQAAGSVAGCSGCSSSASARGPSPEPVAVGRRSPVVSPPKLLPPGRSPSRPCGRIVPSLSASKEESTPAPGSADAPAAVKWAAGSEVSVAGLRIRCKALLGRGSFSEVWSGEVMGSNTELALKDIICKSQADLDQALLEASLLERFQPLATGQVPVMRIPRYYGHRVDSCREGWRICLAMARVPGESLDSWLRKRGNKQQQDGPSSVRRGCALAIALLRQLGPTLSRISSHVWHRDVNSHNILISVAEGNNVEDEEISNRVSFWLIDFGLAVEAQSWPQKWHNTDVAGDCRYWAPSSFVMSFCGPEETAASPDFCSQYKTKLDIVGLGLTALELLCSTALASKETWGPDGLRGSWERLLDTWERYREDVTRWHSMIFQVFTKGGDIGPLYRQLGQAFTYKACCCNESHGCWEPQLSQAVPWGPWAEPPLGNPVEELSVGLFPTYEPGKDCWTGSAATYAKCCDLAMNPMGNIWNCWDNNRFTFERCCFLGEAALDEAPPKPLLRPALRAAATAATAATAPREEEPFLRPAGQECWVNGFTFAACCLAGISSCWDEIFTHAACCDGRPQLPQAGPIVEATDPIVSCLDLSSRLTLDLEQRPRQCPQRYFYLATMGTALIGADRMGVPWWYASDDLQMVKPLRPQRMHFVGGICVPSSCSVEATASYLAPLVAPWWRSPRKKTQPLNASHVTLPPPLALRHKAFGQAKAKINLTFSAWTALRPADGEALADLDRWDFAMIPYRGTAGWSKGKAILIWTAFGALLIFGAVPRGVDLENFLSPSFHLLRLGLPRGPKHLELIRFVLTLLVLVIHVMDHGPWTPVQQHSGAAYLMLLRSCMSRVNIGFVVLLVHLSISRRSLKQAVSCWGWIRAMAFHTLKRWLVIAPVVGAWSLVFVQAPFDDVPMNNILKSNPLYLWYGERRDQCENTFQLVYSVLFIHAPVMGVRSPCHNTDIFESLFQLDLLVYGMLTALGRWRAGQAAHFFWFLAVALSYWQMSPNKEASFNDTCHTFASLLPSAMATLAVSTWLPKHELPMAPRRGRMRVLSCVATLGILVTCFQDGLLHSDFQWPRGWQDLADWVKEVHSIGRGYVIPCHCYEVVLVFGLVVLLKQGWLSPRQEGWSCLRVLARMSTGICVSNLFMLHAMGAFFYEDPIDLNVVSFLAHLLVIFASSLMVSILVHILIEGPFACMLTDGLPQERVVERVISHIAELRGCLLACVKRAEDPSIQRLLTVLAETIDEKSSYDIRQVLEHLDPEPVIKVAQIPVDHSGKLQWSPPETLWSQLRRPFMGGA